MAAEADGKSSSREEQGAARRERRTNVFAFTFAMLSGLGSVGWHGWLSLQLRESAPDAVGVESFGPIMLGAVVWAVLAMTSSRPGRGAFAFGAVVTLLTLRALPNELVLLRMGRAEAAASAAWKTVSAEIEASGKARPEQVMAYVVAERHAALATVGDRAGHHAAFAECVLLMTRVQGDLDAASAKLDFATMGDSRMFGSRDVLRTRLAILKDFAAAAKRSESLRAEVEKEADRQMTAFRTTPATRETVLQGLVELRPALAPVPEHGLSARADRLLQLLTALDDTWGQWSWTAEAGLSTSDEPLRRRLQDLARLPDPGGDATPPL